MQLMRRGFSVHSRQSSFFGFFYRRKLRHVILLSNVMIKRKKKYEENLVMLLSWSVVFSQLTATLGPAKEN